MLRVTQLANEIVRRPDAPKLRVTQVSVETLRRPVSPRLRVSQLSVEVLRKNGSAPSAGGQGSVMLIIAT